MIFPNLRALLSRSIGNDLHGQPKLVSRGPILVSPVKLKFSNQHTTVRTDSAGSHGHAGETVADVVLLVKPNVDIREEDILEIVGHKVKVTGKEPKFTSAGVLDHYRIECAAWV